MLTAWRCAFLSCVSDEQNISEFNPMTFFFYHQILRHFFCYVFVLFCFVLRGNCIQCSVLLSSIFCHCYFVGTRWASHRDQFTSYRQVCILRADGTYLTFCLYFSIQEIICLVLQMMKYVCLILNKNIVVSCFNFFCLVLGIFRHQHRTGDKQSQ